MKNEACHAERWDMEEPRHTRKFVQLFVDSNLPMDVGSITSESTLTYTRHDGWMVGRYVRMRR